MRQQLLGSIAACLLTACASQTPPAPTYPRDLSYTAEATFAKESRNFPGLRLASRTLPANVHLWADLTYKALPYRALTMDVFVPRERASPLPLVLLIHGGGWRSGDKMMIRPLAMGLAERGYVVATANYRLSPEAPFPAAFDDLVDALLWLTQNAAQWGGDATRVAIGGTSAGGQLASLIAYSGGRLDEARLDEAPQQASSSGEPRVRIQALLNIDGLLDFTSAEALPYENDPKREATSASAWLQGRYQQAPEMWRQASPYFYVTAHAPPSLFLNSAKPRFHAGRDATISKLTGHNIATETITLANTPHTFWLFENWLADALTHLDAFLRRVMNDAQ